MPLIRLDKFISERTEYTRSAIKTLAAKGKITVDGCVVKKSDSKIDSETAAVTICGEAVRKANSRSWTCFSAYSFEGAFSGGKARQGFLRRAAYHR